MDKLKQVTKHLIIASNYQPCPPCKEDIRKLSEIVSHLPSLSNSDKHTLKQLSYINEVGTVGKVLTKLISPFFIGQIPESINETIEEDKQGNRQTLNHLLRAHSYMVEMKQEYPYSRIESILKEYVNLTWFKLDCTPKEFYVFDRLIKLGFKTHLLQFTANAITSAKYVFD